MNRKTAIITALFAVLIISGMVMYAFADDMTTTSNSLCDGNGPHGNGNGHHYMRGEHPQDGTGNQFHGQNGQGQNNGTCPYQTP